MRVSRQFLVSMQHQTYPDPGLAGVVEEDQDERNPEGGKHGEEADDQPHHHRRRDQVAKSLHSQEPGEGIALHRLEDVVLGSIEDLWIVAATLFNADSDIMGDGVREGNLALRTREEEGVQDLLGGCSNISPGNGVSGRVGVGSRVLVAAHEAWARLPFMGVCLSRA